MAEKLLTVVIPAYNSAAYIDRAISSLLGAIDKLEIIVVNDGSKDQTGTVVQPYLDKYPDSIQLITKENGGHGSVINLGMRLATGKYFKVLDSDDYFNKEALEKLLIKIEELINTANCPDLIFTDYELELLRKSYYRRVEELATTTLYPRVKDRKHFLYYEKNLAAVLPKNQMFTWKEVKHWELRHLLIMHQLCYRTKFLKQLNLTLPEAVFYEDNYFSLITLQNTQTLYYLPVCLYGYYIGRPDQSVSLKKIVANYQHQEIVTCAIIEALFDLEKQTNQSLLQRESQLNALARYDLTVKHMARLYEMSQLICLLDNKATTKEALLHVKNEFKTKLPELFQLVKKKKLVRFLDFAIANLHPLANVIAKTLRRLDLMRF